ncbi:MAG: 3-methyl-2-oxobutanoate hydroxymethyltransferase [Anaerolineales bacterium]|nr:3-methyl-2-oxobutanoate hydroxymethyltransferase [Anaerolineales bacterium]
MSAQPKVTTSRLKTKKQQGQKITMLTAYDFPMASFIDQAGVDIVLVSDAVGTVGNGRTEAVSVTVDEMIYHTRAVRNGVTHSMVVTTLPFGSYNSIAEAQHSATRLMKEGGADGVHLEGTRQSGQLIRAIVGAGIPVMGHIGITKQKIVAAGRPKLPGRDAGSAWEVIEDALEMAQAGVFALVVECLPLSLAEIVTRSLDIPTISIGSGPACDGQALVTQDMLGLYKGIAPRFLKVYADLSETIVAALARFRQEVEIGAFPTPEYSYTIDDSELNKLLAQHHR